MNLTGKFSVYLLVSLLSLGVVAQPVINSFSPVSGPAGTSVTITGNNFSTTAAGNIVYFGAVRASVTAATTNSLSVTVPAGATYRPITVTVNGLTAFSTQLFSVTFPGGGLISFNSFDPAVNFTTDLRPNALAIADFDGDGKSDIATPNDYHYDGQPASISILRNIANGDTVLFAPKQDISVGAVAYAIAAGDIDGDGKQDLVASSLFDQTISVYRNTSTTGNISFAPKIDYASGGSSVRIAITDIDGDGKPDIVLVNSTENLLSFFRNTGTTGVVAFEARVNINTALYPKDMAIGDFDGDGEADVAITNKFSNSFSVYKNLSTPGNFLFMAATDIALGTGMEPFGITAADLDTDGKIDLAVVLLNKNTGTSFARLYRNNSAPGTMSFNLSTSVNGTSTESYYIGAGDINGDGQPDLAFPLANQSNVKVFQNNSTTGSLSFSQIVYLNSSFGPFAVSLADLNGDSRPELIVANFTLESISVFRNRCGTPRIDGFTPVSAASAEIVTITGANFSAATAVSFGGVAAASYTVVNANTITAAVGNGVSGDISVTTPLGTGTKTGFIFEGPPVINAFSPVGAGNAETVTINGNNFTGATVISFGGVTAVSFTVVNANTITAVVGAGATGAVSVTTPFGTVSVGGFTHLPKPIINTYTPTSAGEDTTVTLTGINFTGTTAVSFGGLAAKSFTVVNATTLTAVVGNGGSGEISVTNAIGTGTKSGFIFIPAPVIISFTPISAIIGTTIQITGSDFSNASSVMLGGVAVRSFTVASATSITAVVGTGASGNVEVVTPGGKATRPGFTFIKAPTIGSFSPASGPTGTTVTITGSDFSSNAAENIVYFGTVKATVIASTATTITVLVPVSASYQNISVTTNKLTAVSDRPFIVTFPGAGLELKTSAFSQEVKFIGGFVPNDVTAEDLDGDGKPDVIIPSLTDPRTISILRNTSSGGVVSFAPKTDFVTSWVPYYLATGDFNGDGKKDIAATNEDNTISVFINTGNIGTVNFAPRIDILANSMPIGITTNDFNGDGRVDIAVWMENSTVTVYANTSGNGTVSFSKAVSFDVGSFALLTIYSADIDGDKKPDILLPRLQSMKVSIYRNTSSGGGLSFDTAVNVAANYNNTDIAIGDLDGDNKPDIISNTQNTGHGTMAISKNQSSPGNILFAPEIIIGTEMGLSDVDLADMDGDGKIDIVIPISHIRYGLPASISVFKNKSTPGNIALSDYVEYFYTDPKQGVPNATVLGDYNNDGKPDIGSIWPTTSKFTVLTNQVGGPGILSFTPARGPAGTVVTITGTDFINVTAVNFGAVPAQSFSVESPERIVAVVGNGASGMVSVTAGGGTAAAPGFDFVAPPVITSFTPDRAGSDTTITINGQNFNGVISVSLGEVAASSFTVVDSVTIKAVVGPGSSGAVTVVTEGGTGSKDGFIFLPPPNIISFTPGKGGAGSVILIKGTNLAEASAVSFGGVAATSFTVIDAETISAVAGTGASGDIVVVTPGGEASITGFIYGDVNELLVSPNPAHDFVYVQCPLSGQSSRLDLFTSQGVLIRSKIIAAGTTFTALNIQGVTPGLYRLVWKNGNKRLTLGVMIY